MSMSPTNSLNSPFVSAQADDDGAFFANVKKRIRTAWRRHQFKRIQQAIASYSSEKHFLSPMFRPVAGPATMRMANREIERNKLPFNPESGRPWLANAHPKSPLHLAARSEMTLRAQSVSELPASILGLRRDTAATPDEPSDTSPIILIT